MKYVYAYLFLLLTVFSIEQSHAQFLKKLVKKVGETVEETVIDKIDKKASKETEKTLDSLLDTKPKGRKKRTKNSEKLEEADSPKVTSAKSGVSQVSSFRSYSKFDFISGEQLLTFEDFSQDEVGDLPAKWNATNSIEVVTLEGVAGKWAKFVEGEGAFIPDFIDQFPDNFTLEFDVIFDFDISKYCFKRNLSIIFTDIENPAYNLNSETPGKNGFIFKISGGISYDGFLNYSKYTPNRQLNTHADKENQSLKKDNLGRGKVHHVSIWRQKQRMRVYFNEEKVFDIPRAFENGVEINAVRFFSSISESDTYYFLSNFRYAIGKPDMRSKLITEGKLVTYGITFDVNSSQIKPSSYGTLKQIASILKEHPDLQVAIIGHTDADGSEETNLSLSEKRAGAVKLALIYDFSVSASQLSSKGKGETELIDTGNSLESKARNRRVEFIKQ